MKKILLLLPALVAAITAMASVTIGDRTYQADTLWRRQVGPGITTTIVRLPEYPLNIYITQTDLNNPHNRVETTLGHNTVGRTETLVNAAKRQRTPTKRPIVACNGNFWCVSSEFPHSQYELGTPYCSVVRNDTIYVNAETNDDRWSYGPHHTGGTAISRDKRLFFDIITPAGTISGENLTAPIEFSTVNRRNLPNSITFWTPAYSRTREFESNWVSYVEKGTANADNYYLMLEPDSRWAINGEMTFTVEKIVTNADRQTLGQYDACFTCTGDKKALMAQLREGDRITVNYGMTVGWDNDTRQTPQIENMIEGLALVMKNDTLTYRNYDDTYNTKTYSRTLYGASADRKHLSMMVIDMSQSKRYGRSAGCNTETACLILKSLCPDVSNIVSMDAGGSAMMLVNGEIISTTTEGTPRAIACGWMVEAIGEEDSVVTSIAFDDWRVDAPVFSSYTPVILGYNARGELVNTDVRGFTLTCDPTLGTTSGDTFTASGNITSGTLTATLGNATATVTVRTLDAQPAITLRPNILLDDREYPIEVTADIADKSYPYDPSRLGWTINNTAVASLNNGTLRGIANGTAQITCQIGTFLDTAQVTVEIPDTSIILQDFDNWTLRASGAKDINLAGDGTLSFTYSGGRAPYISARKDITFYSLPDTVALEFTTTLPLDYIQIDARNRDMTSTNYVKYGEDTGYEAGQRHRLAIDMDQLGGADNVGTYPIGLREIKFVPSKSATSGGHVINIHRLYSHYTAHTAHITGDLDTDGRVDVSDLNLLINIMLGAAPETPLADIDHSGSTDVADLNTLINIILEK